MSKIFKAIKKIAKYDHEFPEFEADMDLEPSSQEILDGHEGMRSVLDNEFDLPEEYDYELTPEQELEVNNFWEEKFAPKQEDKFAQDYMPKLKSAPTRPMPEATIPYAQKPKSIETTQMPMAEKPKSKNQIVEQMQALIEEIKALDIDE